MGAALSTALYLGSGAIGVYMLYMCLQPVWTWKLRHIPGPRMAMPLLGHLPAIIQSGNMTVWMEQQARKYGPIYKFWNGSTPAVCLTDAESTRKMLLSCNTRPDLDFFWVLVGEEYTVAHNVLLNLPGDIPQFRTLRKAFENAVQIPSALEQHAGMLVEVTGNLVKHLQRYAETGEPVDVTKPLSDMTMDAIGFAAFGLSFDNLTSGPKDYVQPPGWEDAPIGSTEFSRGLVAATRTMVRTSDPATSSPWKVLGLLLPNLYGFWCRLANWLPDASLREEVQARKTTQYACKRMIQQWRDSRQQGGAQNGGAVYNPAIRETGFLARLLQFQESEGWSELDIIAQALMMLLAGYETTASSLACALYLLAQHPEVQAKAQKEVDEALCGKVVGASDVEQLPLIRGIFDEALRLHPPGDAVLRNMKTPFTLDLGPAVSLPEGTAVWASLYALQRDPAIWPRAEEFLPERHVQPGNEHLAPSTPNAYLPFGLGPRMCPGYKFAQLEGKLALAKLMQAYTFSLAPNKPPVKFLSGLVYCPDAVWLTVSKRT